MTRRIAIIPARGGSKRIPRKNTRSFAGQPAFTHILQAATESGVFDRIHVSTDDEEIAEIAEQHGAMPDFYRDASLADDHTPIRSVISWTLREYEKRGEVFDVAALLYATAFFIEPGDLKAAATAFDADPATALLSVADIGTPIEKLFIEKHGLLRAAKEADFGSRTQDLTPAFQDAGAFAFYAANALIGEQDGAAPMAFRAFVIDRLKAIDIDTEEGWAFAERLHAARTNS